MSYALPAIFGASPTELHTYSVYNKKYVMDTITSLRMTMHLANGYGT